MLIFVCSVIDLASRMSNDERRTAALYTKPGEWRGDEQATAQRKDNDDDDDDDDDNDDDDDDGPADSHNNDALPTAGKRSTMFV